MIFKYKVCGFLNLHIMLEQGDDSKHNKDISMDKEKCF